MTKTKTIKMGFSMSGKWFTWLLRHLWVEGSETKAIKMWTAAFPDHANVAGLKGPFLDIVSGRKKFTGDTNSKEGFGFAEDGTKFWDPQQDEVPCDSHPLLDCWEDVILKKKLQLFVEELRLRAFRLNRQWPDDVQGNWTHSLRRISRAEENVVENQLTRTAGTLWSEIRNMAHTVGLPVELIDIPAGTAVKSTFSKSRAVLPEKGTTGVKESLDVVNAIMDIAVPIQEYFKKKYGGPLVHVNYAEILSLYGLDDGLRSTKMRAMTAERREGIKIKDWKPTPVWGDSWEEPDEEEYIQRKEEEIDKILHDGPEMLGLPSAAACGNPVADACGMQGLDLDTYIADSMRESERGDTIEPEQAQWTKWNAGWITPEGKFYGCAQLGHNGFSERLCRQLDVEPEDEYGGAMYALENLGWIKVSAGRFFWKDEYHPLGEQWTCMWEFMQAHKYTKCVFNKKFSSALQTYEDAIRDEAEKRGKL